MPPLEPPKVPVLAKDGPQGRAWAGSLASLTPWVWNSSAEVPVDALVEVIVTDLPVGDASDELGGRADRCVTIGVGTAAAADLVLPAGSSRFCMI